MKTKASIESPILSILIAAATSAVLVLSINTNVLDPFVEPRMLAWGIGIIGFSLFLQQKSETRFVFAGNKLLLALSCASFHIIWMIIGTTISDEPIAGLPRIISTVYLCITAILIAVYCAKSKNALHVLAFAANVTVVLLALGALWEMVLSDSFPLTAGAKPHSFTGNKNLFASCCVIAAAIGAYALQGKILALKRFALIALACTAFILGVTLSRAAILAASSAVAIWLAYSRKNSIKARLWRAARTGALISVFFFAGIWMQESPVAYKAAFILSIETDSSATNRLAAWHKTSKMIAENSIFGVGAGQWKTSLPGYGLQGLLFTNDGRLMAHAHNDFLETAAETGIPGLFTFLSVYVALLLSHARLPNKLSEKRRFASGMVLAGSAAFAIVALFDFPFSRPMHLMLLSIITGVAIAGSTDDSGAAIPQLKWHVFVIIISVCGIVITLKRINVEKNLKKALTIFPTGNQCAQVVQLLDLDAFFYQLDPIGTPVSYYRGSCLLKIGRIEAGLRELEKALEQAPNHPEVLFNLSVTYAKIGQLNAALRLVRHASRITSSDRIARLHQTLQKRAAVGTVP